MYRYSDNYNDDDNYNDRYRYRANRNAMYKKKEIKKQTKKVGDVMREWRGGRLAPLLIDMRKAILSNRQRAIPKETMQRFSDIIGRASSLDVRRERRKVMWLLGAIRSGGRSDNRSDGDLTVPFRTLLKRLYATYDAPAHRPILRWFASRGVRIDGELMRSVIKELLGRSRSLPPRYVGVIDALLDLGVRPNRNGVLQETFKLAARDDNPERIAKLFAAMFAHRANPNARAEDTRETPLHLAIELGARRAALVVPLILRAGANPDVPDRNGDTAVHRLIEKMKDPKKEAALLDAMLNTSRRALVSRNSLGWTPMHLAAFVALETPVFKRVLVSKRLEDRDREGNTVLHLACSPQKETRSVLPNVELLIKEGADVNARDRQRATPLHRALRSLSDPPPVTQALWNAGADPSIKDRTGKAPMDLVRNGNFGGANKKRNDEWTDGTPGNNLTPNGYNW